MFQRLKCFNNIWKMCENEARFRDKAYTFCNKTNDIIRLCVVYAQKLGIAAPQQLRLSLFCCGYEIFGRTAVLIRGLHFLFRLKILLYLQNSNLYAYKTLNPNVFDNFLVLKLLSLELNRLKIYKTIVNIYTKLLTI